MNKLNQLNINKLKFYNHVGLTTYLYINRSDYN